jgi:prepilin-type N-terminal cleavage/methylation domain-containing protein
MTIRHTPGSDDHGFTFVELLTVILIIGILVAVTVPTFLGQRSKAFGATATSDLHNAALAEEAQMTDSGVYVTNLSALTAAGFRRSAGVQLGVAVGASGYCEVAAHDGQYWWFDSAAGGVQHATTTSLTPPATANGVCSSAVPTQLS